MKPYLIVAASLFLALGACGDKSSKKDDEKADKDTKESAEAKTTTTATASATASASAEAVAVASESAAPIDAVPTADIAEDNPSAFASVEVPASVSVPTEEDYEADVEKEITPENAEVELSKLEKALDAGTP